ncbi:hypothetical protein [Anaerobranca gottschalkii]|uniref:Uncharacterized protein n=1 Tax=Anaerobranca gottschalkii DSM 13577 TaxID=1120990 RepID=A0A1H9YDL6_9FIRM|nr:hypothetical protein [Anaerobranca gottschalkii]SES67070.1 hypothetical protein SAMN03080614_1002140 [Anaerobranca gottschalkii DSM 13577]
MDPFEIMEKNFPKLIKILTYLGIMIIVVQILLSNPTINRMLVLITRLEGR